MKLRMQWADHRMDIIFFFFSCVLGSLEKKEWKGKNNNLIFISSTFYLSFLITGSNRDFTSINFIQENGCPSHFYWEECLGPSQSFWGSQAKSEFGAFNLYYIKLIFINFLLKFYSC